MIYESLTEKCRSLYAELETLTELNNRMKIQIELNTKRKESILSLLDTTLDHESIYWPGPTEDPRDNCSSEVMLYFIENPDEPVGKIAQAVGVTRWKATDEIDKFFKQKIK